MSDISDIQVHTYIVVEIRVIYVIYRCIHSSRDKSDICDIQVYTQ